MINQTDLHGAKILIVDDDEDVVRILQCLLAAVGYVAVTSTTNGCDVCALHQIHHYDLIVLDMNMPGMNGFEVIERLKQIEGDEYLPVLVVTAEADYKLRALEAGARDFLCKPFDRLEVVTRIRNMLEVRLLYTASRNRVEHMAHYDSLTGLPNRNMFIRELAHSLQTAGNQLSAVLVIDLDGFKRINDNFGEMAGDAVLGQFAQRLGACLPSHQGIARLGNDEFALVLTAIAEPLAAIAAAHQIRATLALPFCLPELEVRITACIGIAVYPGDSGDATTLLKYANTALNQAKQDGADNVRFFTDAMNIQGVRRFEFEHALRKACDNGEFELVYQPKVQISSDRVVGVEALLRWNWPGHPQVQPAEFISLLEETGLIVQVGAWVIRTACRQIALWSRLPGGPVHIAVNVSSRQFSDSCLETVVSDAIAEYGIDAGLLGLEVTESALMCNTDRTVSTLANLRAKGIRISIDDFGTGYSSLAYLKRFPLDTLKIDIAFIRDIISNPNDAAMVGAIITMAHSLGLEVIAEGVETAAQLAYLGRHRCDQIQGYFFSRPLPAAGLEQFLQAAVCQPVSPEVPDTVPPTLLIIDDEAHVRSSLQRLLRQDGYRILTASGATEAFNLLAQTPVHLVMCDQRMEEMSGTELLDKIKDMYPHTLRIILSGYTDLQTIMEAVNRGALYRFYTKPWDNQTLRENIRAAFSHYWRLHGQEESASRSPPSFPRQDGLSNTAPEALAMPAATNDGKHPAWVGHLPDQSFNLRDNGA